MKKEHLALNIIGMLLGIGSVAMACFWYDWKLAVILITALWGNNLKIK